jgi:hypothetical protein
VPPEVVAHTLVLDFNDADALARAFERDGKNIASSYRGARGGEHEPDRTAARVSPGLCATCAPAMAPC